MAERKDADSPKEMMMKGPHRFSKWTLFSLLILLVAAAPVSPEELAVDPFDAVVLFSNVKETLSLIDDFTAGLPGRDPAAVSPTAMLRGILGGTDWLDSSRAIAAGIVLNGEGGAPRLSLWLPYAEPNPAFAETVKAISGKDYYYFTFPPGVPATADDPGFGLLQEMGSAKKGTVGTVKLMLPLARLVETNRESIDSFLKGLAAKEASAEQTHALVQTADIDQMLMAMLETAGQVEVASLAVDVNRNTISTRTEALAKPDSRMHQLFSDSSRTTRLASYEPDYPIRFRSRGYDMAAFIELLGDSFGSLYEKLGVDMAALASISADMTGEMAGGMRYAEAGPMIELVAVLKEEDVDLAFVEKKYLPWLIASGEKLQQQLNPGEEPIYTRTEDSEIDGHRVVGVKTRMPTPPGAAGASTDEGPQKTMEYELRLTTINDMLLAAPNDRRLEKLIALSGTFEEEPAPGHLMDIVVNMGEYIKAAADYLPDNTALPQGPLPEGEAEYHVDFQKGRATVSTPLSAPRTSRQLVAYTAAIGRFRGTEGAGTAETRYPAANHVPAVQPGRRGASRALNPSPRRRRLRNTGLSGEPSARHTAMIEPLSAIIAKPWSWIPEMRTTSFNWGFPSGKREIMRLLSMPSMKRC
jgi:hypothetical protein